MRTGVLVATAVVSLAATVSAPAGEPGSRGEIERPAEPAESVEKANVDEKLDRFVAAYRAVDSIRKAETGGGYEDPDARLSRMQEAIREAGLTVEEYESIAAEARFDQRVRDRIFRILNRQGGTEVSE